MISTVDILILLLIGCAGGFIAGLIGIGGGPIFVLVYNEYFYKLFAGSGLAQDDTLVKIIIANSVLSMTFAAIAGSWRHYKSKNFHPKAIFLIGIPAVAFSIFTTYLLSFTHNYSEEKFSILFILFLIPITLKILFTKENNQTNVEITPYVLIFIGCLCGIVAALTGLGGGIVIIPILSSILKVPIKKTMSISLGVIALVGIGFSLYNFIFVDFPIAVSKYAFNYIVFPVIIPVIIGVFFAAFLGVNTAKKLSPLTLKVIFLVFFFLVICKMGYSLFN